MKMKLLCSVLLSACMAGVSLGATLFVHNFDNINGATLEDRLTADYAVGSAAPVEIVTVGSYPDVFDMTPLFGDGALRNRWGYNDNILLTYGALNNVDVTQGTFEVWVNVQNANNRFDRYFAIGTPTGETIDLFLNANDKAFRLQVRSGGPGASYKAIQTPNDTAAVEDRWKLLGAEWKLDSQTLSENFIRIYLDGVLQDEEWGFGRMQMEIDENSVFGLGTPAHQASFSSNRNWMDSARVTSSLMSDLYALDANGNYTPPTAAFVPEPVSLSLLLLGGIIWHRRQIR